MGLGFGQKVEWEDVILANFRLRNGICNPSFTTLCKVSF